MFHIFIASCIEGIDTQIPRLLNNIRSCPTIPRNCIHFIVGGCPEEHTEILDDGIEIMKVPYRCFEFTPHIYIAKNPDKYDFEYGFFTHDTVIFGNAFYDVVQKDIEILKEEGFDTQKIENSIPSMNIGIYSKNIILFFSKQLLELCQNSNDPETLMQLKHKLTDYEDFMFKTYKNKQSADTSTNQVTQLRGKNGTLSNGLIRHFERIDFIKYQQNAYKIQSIDIVEINNYKKMPEIIREIYISRYNKSCDWLDELKNKYKITIYNKGEPFEKKGCHVKNIPNIGLDQAGILDFIIDNYNNLADVTLFTHDDFEVHLFDNCTTANIYQSKFQEGDVNYYVERMFKEAEEFGHSQNAFEYKLFGDFNTSYKFKIQHPNITSVQECFGEWFEKFIGKPFPHEKILWFKNAIFAIQKKYILSRPIEYYKNLRSEFKNLHDEVIHFMERSWYYAWGTMVPQSPSF